MGGAGILFDNWPWAFLFSGVAAWRDVSSGSVIQCRNGHPDIFTGRVWQGAC
jgi:hypothetical protein